MCVRHLDAEGREKFEQALLMPLPADVVRESAADRERRLARRPRVVEQSAPKRGADFLSAMGAVSSG